MRLTTVEHRSNHWHLSPSAASCFKRALQKDADACFPLPWLGFDVALKILRVSAFSPPIRSDTGTAGGKEKGAHQWIRTAIEPPANLELPHLQPQTARLYPVQPEAKALQPPRKKFVR
jgi:hypothetical protein